MLKVVFRNCDNSELLGTDARQASKTHFVAEIHE